MSICGMLRLLGKGVRAYPATTHGQCTELDPASVVGSIATYVQVWLVRRDLMLEAGSFDEALPLCDDWELLLRLSQRTRIQVIGLPLAISAQEPDSLTVRNPQWELRIQYVLDKHRTHLSRYPRALAGLHYLHARFYAATGRITEARGCLRASLYLRPLSLKPWLLLGLVLLGRTAVRRALKPSVIA